MRDQQRLRSACASVQSDMSISVSVSVSLSLKAVETLWYNSSVVNDLSINSQVWFVSVARAQVSNFEF